MAFDAFRSFFGSSRRVALLALFAYIALAVLLTLPAWHDPAHLYVGEGADPQQSMWFMRWFPFALTHGHNPWTTDYLNYPAGINLLWNTGQPLMSLLLWPVTAMFGVVVAYNLEVTLSLALSAWCAFFALRRYTRTALSASLGGLLYGFSPFMLGQLHGHPHLVVEVIPPLLLLVIDDVLIRCRHSIRRNGLLLGLLLGAQFFISEEMLVYELMALVVLTLGLWGVHRCDPNIRERRGRLLRVLAIAAGVGIVLTAWPVVVQLFGPQRAPQAIQGPDIFVSDAAGFLLPTAAQAVHPLSALFSSNVGNASELSAYLGLPLLLLLATYGWAHRSRPAVRVVYLSAAVVALLSMGPHLHLFGHRSPIPLPWDLLGRLPLLEKLLPARLMLFVFLAAGLAFAWSLEWLWASGGRLLGVGAAVLVTISLWPTLPVPITGTVLPDYFSRSPAAISAGAPTLVLPYPSGASIEPMFWQAQADFPLRLVGGYFIGPASQDSPVPSWQQDWLQLSLGRPLVTEDTTRLRGELTSAGIRYVMVGPQAYRNQVASLVREVLGGEPVYDDGAVTIWATPAP